MQLRAEYGGKHIYSLKVNLDFHCNSVGLDTFCEAVGISKLVAINHLDTTLRARMLIDSIGVVRCQFRLGQNEVRHLVHVFPGGAPFTIGHETAHSLGLDQMDSDSDWDDSSMPSLE